MSQENAHLIHFRFRPVTYPSTLCPDSSCNNRGTCFYGRRGNKCCHFSDDFVGNKCQFLYNHNKDLDCARPVSSCLNGGSCYRNALRNTVCACLTGYRGERCELESRTVLEDSGPCQIAEHNTYKGESMAVSVNVILVENTVVISALKRLQIYNIYCGEKLCHGRGICLPNRSGQIFCVLTDSPANTVNSMTA